MPTVSQEYCAKCGYDLTGLPVSGPCPECGQAYDAAAGYGIQSPESMSERSGRITARLRTIAWGVAAVLCLGCGSGLTLVVKNTQTALWLGVIFAGMCALAALTSYLYEGPE